jgi:hypothetical protein
MPYPPHRIKYLLEEVGYTLTRFSAEHGFKKPEVSMCINKVRVYPEIRIAISNLIGRSVETVFGPHPLTTAILEGRETERQSAA